MWLVALFALTLSALAGVRDARAQDGGDFERHVDSVLLAEVAETARTLGKRALARARRSYVLGPSAGVAGALSFDGESDAAISFGIGITKFDISLFANRRALVEKARGRLKQLMAERAAAALAGGAPPSDADMRRFAEEAWAELRAELFSELAPKRFEKPGVSFRLEGTYLSRQGAFDLRLFGAIGVSKVFVGLGAALRIDDGAALVVPVELSVPMALSMAKRSPLLHFFARVEVAATSRDEFDDLALVGMRLQLDVI